MLLRINMLGEVDSESYFNVIVEQNLQLFTAKTLDMLSMLALISMPATHQNIGVN